MNDKNNSEIDLLELLKHLWFNRKKIIVWGAIGAVAGIVVAFSIPKEYTVTIKIAPENNTSKTNQVGAIASLMGLNTAGSNEGINERIYPEILQSSPFLNDFTELTVVNKKDTTLLRNYILNDQKKAWWSYITALPGTIIGAATSMFSDKEELPFEKSPDLKNRYSKAIASMIDAQVDTKTGIIAIKLTMQNPNICLQIADSLISNLQKYIVDYKTSKTQGVLASNKKMLAEAKQKYYLADSLYAQTQDRNTNLISRSKIILMDRLQNEKDLAYRIYQDLAQQVSTNEIKLREEMPIATIIEPATLPIIPSAPNKKLIIVAFVFLGGCAMVSTVIIKKNING